MKKWFSFLALALVAAGIILAYSKFKPTNPVSPDDSNKPVTVNASYPELYFVSGQKIMTYRRTSANSSSAAGGQPAGETKELYKAEADPYLFKDPALNSILPSPNHGAVALILQGGEVKQVKDAKYFEGNLKLEIWDSAGWMRYGYLLASELKVVSLAYFWRDDSIWLKMNVMGPTGNAAPQYFLMPNHGPAKFLDLKGADYDAAVKLGQLEIVFSDFTGPAYRRNNQYLNGGRLYLDRDVIAREEGSERVPVLRADQFFQVRGSLLNSFQVSPDQKKIAFNRDISDCGKNELYIYDIEQGRQSQVAMADGSLDFLWLDSNTLAFDQGSSDSEQVSIYSLSSGRSWAPLIAQEPQGLFFTTAGLDCADKK